MRGEHDFERVTEFCRNCGASREAAGDRDICCRDGVVAISHIIARRRMNDLIWPAQRHSDSVHGVCGSEATEVAKNASAAVGPHAAPLRGNGE